MRSAEDNEQWILHAQKRGRGTSIGPSIYVSLYVSAVLGAYDAPPIITYPRTRD